MKSIVFNQDHCNVTGDIAGQLISYFIDSKIYKVTKYISDKFVIKVTRRCKDKNLEVVVTAGRPNYLERLFIKQAKKAGEPFPIKKPQLKFKEGR